MYCIDFTKFVFTYDYEFQLMSLQIICSLENMFKGANCIPAKFLKGAEITISSLKILSKFENKRKLFEASLLSNLSFCMDIMAY